MTTITPIPRIGFNMHPLWAFGETLADFLEPLRAVGLSALEFELWPNDPHWSRIPPLMEECRRLGFALCFHAPYRKPYALTGFAGQERAEVEAGYAPMLDIAARFAPAAVVIHGAHSATRPRERLVADTVAFLEWTLARYPALTMALENLGPDPRRIKIGTERAEVLRIVEEIGNPRLGICWDMGHDVLAGRHGLPDEAWLRQVCHVHLHDIDERGIDHYPLIYGRVPWQTWLPALVRAGFTGVVTLEIKGGQLAGLGIEQAQQMLVDSVGEVRRLLALPSSGMDS
jgi:sugar phosphate isomerase/epimerase